MGIAKFLLITALVTGLALGYVYQQAELLRINYTIGRNKDSLVVLLDHNSALMYNVNHLQTPLYLEQRLSAEKVSVEIPSRWHTIGLAEAAR
jgi:hypothetical protein